MVAVINLLRFMSLSGGVIGDPYGSVIIGCWKWHTLRKCLKHGFKYNRSASHFRHHDGDTTVGFELTVSEMFETLFHVVFCLVRSDLDET